MWQRVFSDGLRALAGAAVLAALLSPSDVAAQLPPPASEPIADPPADTDELLARDPRLLTTGEMKSLSQKYAVDIVISIGKIVNARRRALSERDIIKVTCIDQLLPEMKQLGEVLSGRFVAIARRSDEFPVRAEFVVISPGWQRINELRREAEECTGQSLDGTINLSTSHNVPPSDESDPSNAAAGRPNIAARPDEASRFR
jgi:hypothetical protein